jgi:hypothetical protein
MSAKCHNRTYVAPQYQLRFGVWIPVEKPSTASKADLSRPFNYVGFRSHAMRSIREQASDRRASALRLDYFL